MARESKKHWSGVSKKTRKLHTVICGVRPGFTEGDHSGPLMEATPSLEGECIQETFFLLNLLESSVYNIPSCIQI